MTRRYPHFRRPPKARRFKGRCKMPEGTFRFFWNPFLAGILNKFDGFFQPFQWSSGGSHRYLVLRHGSPWVPLRKGYEVLGLREAAWAAELSVGGTRLSGWSGTAELGTWKTSECLGSIRRWWHDLKQSCKDIFVSGAFWWCLEMGWTRLCPIQHASSFPARLWRCNVALRWGKRVDSDKTMEWCLRRLCDVCHGPWAVWPLRFSTFDMCQVCAGTSDWSPWAECTRNGGHEKNAEKVCFCFRSNCCRSNADLGAWLPTFKDWCLFGAIDVARVYSTIRRF